VFLGSFSSFQKKINKAITLGMLVSFLLTQTVLPGSRVAWADVSEGGLPLDAHAVHRLTLPEELGNIVDRFRGNSEKVVIYIQDAHAVSEAQTSILNLINHFQVQYDVNYIGIEGVEGPLDSHFYRTFPDRRKLKDVFLNYLSEGELSGAAVASVVNSQSGIFEGIESWELYTKGVAHFQRALEAQAHLK